MIEKLKNLLQNDLITFSVLYRIIQQEHEYLESDYENYIICYSEKPYPIWLWTKENISDEKLNEAISKLIAKYPLSNGFTYNVRKEIANKIPNSEIRISMISYTLNELKNINYVNGKTKKATMDDFALVTKYMNNFYKEAFQDLRNDLDEYEIRKKALNGINKGEFYLFENIEGVKVALTKLSYDKDTAHIGYVYTVPEFRRMGYAESLVHFLCKMALEKNFTPTLYADESYIASNNCYVKLGFKKRGSIVELKSK